jgi:NADPH-dependent 2,4-dienoyl-CoA reductase/sulfur reductase-like enzyme
MARGGVRATLVPQTFGRRPTARPRTPRERSTTVDTHPTHVLIAGGGVAALEAALALKALGDRPHPGEQIAPEKHLR